ncbi:MAG TPA: N-acetylmuramic acid 6-phosphate etherase [Pyrinomonadaceae bacterium]|nr:N-acetylmuramic acid 6-phosphate etherase [Pyrinomonadaceae bacterium]
MSLPITEQENPRTREIDKLPVLEALRLINDEDKQVALAVERILPEVAAVIEQIAERLKSGGRLFYIGAGTSGRLGVLDASECPPTFGVSPELVQGVIAGGWDALYKAVEASEDDRASGASDLQKRGLNGKDAVVGIAASGRTPYTIGAIEFARKLGCFTAALTCVPGSAITQAAEISLVPIVGAEVIAGSSRLKAGTSHKMILNMISTETMIRLGYVSGNRMTNVKPSNEKLKERSLRILMAETDLDEAAASDLMNRANGDLRAAIVMQKANVSFETAEKALQATENVIEQAIELARK